MAEDGEVITICNSMSRVILCRSFTCEQALFIWLSQEHFVDDGLSRVRASFFFFVQAPYWADKLKTGEVARDAQPSSGRVVIALLVVHMVSYTR